MAGNQEWFLNAKQEMTSVIRQHFEEIAMVL